MDIPVNATFVNPDGSVMVHNDGKGNIGDPITVKDALIMTAVQELPQDAQSPNVMQEKLMRFKLYQKLLKDEKGIVSFTLEECAHIKDRIGKIFGTLVAAPVALLLSGEKDHGLVLPKASVTPLKPELPVEKPIAVETDTK